MDNGHIIYQGPYKYMKNSNFGLENGVLGTEVSNSNPKEITEDEINLFGECRGLDEKEEKREVDEVSWRVYWSFFKAGSPPAILVSFVLFYILVQGNKRYSCE